MNRRQFIAALAAAGVRFSRASAASAPLPVPYAKASPYAAALRFVEPGRDEFAGEKAATELEARLRREFAASRARFYALPGDRVRYEIKSPGEYRTGVWQMPDRKPIWENLARFPKPLFRDVTEHVFGKENSFREQLLPGNPYWRARLDSACGIDVYGNQGISVADIDGDGIDEIYVCQPGGLPNRLYKIRGDGTAEDITGPSGLGVLDETTCALFADFSNSGSQDAVILRSSGPLLFLNRGNGIFVEKPDAFRFQTAPQGSFTGMAAADFDRDGRLDLYLCCYIYFQSEDQYQYPAPYEDARNGPPNFLFRNRGAAEGPMFEDVTAETGMNENNDRFSFAPSWCDFDGDGWPDLYVANDFGRANFYRNHNGKFRDEGEQAGLDGAGPGMSASWFDYDGDGRPDLYVSDMWTAAGQRVVADPAFRPAARDREAFRRHTKGNCLYRNRGDGTFEETGAKEAVEMGRWAWSSGGFDWDLDGTPEIFVTTGMITNGAAAHPDLNSFFWRQVVAKTPEKPRAAAEYENGWNALNQLIREDYSWNGHEPNVFYTKAQSPTGVSYVDASGVSGLDFADDTRTFAVTDFDGDGVPDLILKSRLGPQIRAIQNDCGAGRPSIAISLRGIQSNRDAIGARVDVNGQVQWLSAGSGFLSQHSKRLYFGLAGRETADVKIAWPSGATHEATALEPHYAYTFVEGSSEHSRTPFRRREAFPVSDLAGKNEPEFRDAWLLEPAPMPDSRSPNGTAGFVVFHGAERPTLPSELPIVRVDLTAEKSDVAACYSLFRRYLFEYRADLSVPLTLLTDEKGRACKIYSRIPSAREMKSDLARITDGPALALPFPGKYYRKPKRNLFKLGAAFYWAGYPDRALPYLAETLRASPDNWKALLAIARIQLELGRDKDALASFQRVVALKSDYPPAFVGAGESYARVGEAAKARAMFDKAMALDPKCADAMNQLGLLSASANDLSTARGWFKKALEAEPDHPGAINNLGVLYAKLGQPNDSIAAFRYGIQTNPDDDELYLNLARIYVTMSEREKARAVLNQLLEHKPGNSVATKALAELEAR